LKPFKEASAAACFRCLYWGFN